jgi:hypothetical protein
VRRRRRFGAPRPHDDRHLIAQRHPDDIIHRDTVEQADDIADCHGSTKCDAYGFGHAEADTDGFSDAGAGSGYG